MTDQASGLGPLTIVGCGTLGQALLAALLESGAAQPSELRATARSAARLTALAEHGVLVSDDNPAAVDGARVVVLAVKPHNLDAVVAEIAPSLREDAVVVSVAAGVRLEAIEAGLGRPLAVIRAMPNTPSRVRAGMTVLSPGTHADEPAMALARRCFDAVGRTMVLPERHLDAVTGLSASGPAFIYVVLEALAEGGVKCGLPRAVATELVAQAALGAATLVLESGAHPAVLKDEVTTPAGCTIDGLLELEAGGARVALIKAITTAARRASELG